MAEPAPAIIVVNIVIIAPAGIGRATFCRAAPGV